ncbi:MAG: glycoside hydrolase family 32 protein [Lachnospiraceae bacterium]|nr:glycoside hydrolase family 32 protein [Lachnospiraceae bacterium]
MSELLEKARSYEKAAIHKVSEHVRPVFHFSNPVGWMNDPNGFSEYKGEHHLFFQYYPYATRWDSMHWGHAKSGDFITWEYLPAALAPDQEYDNFGVFSGSAIEDGDKQVLIYTGVAEKALENGEKKITQDQCIATGDGIDFEKCTTNPVITSDLLPEGSSSEDFRDPKLWKEDGRYYVVVGSRSQDGSGQIALFYSDDLKSWKLGNILDQSENKLGKMWECPDFFALGDKRVLVISPQEMEAEGLEFHNGNNAVFLLGDYEKEKMQFTREKVQSADYGLDFYAPQTMLTEDGRRVMIAWMQSWDNAMYPADQPWSGMMTIPRELSVQNGRVYQLPVRELENYRKNVVTYSDVCIESETVLQGIEGRTIDLELKLKGTEYGKCRIKLASGEKHYSEIIYDRKDGILTFDRTYSGFRRDTISTRSMLVRSCRDVLKLRILVDRYSVEIFVNDGEQAMTSLIYTPQSAVGITFSSNGKVYMDAVKYDIEAES